MQGCNLVFYDPGANLLASVSFDFTDANVQIRGCHFASLEIS